MQKEPVQNQTKKPFSSFQETRSYLKYKMSEWILRLLKTDILELDVNFFRCLYWLIGDLRSILKDTIRGMENLSIGEKNRSLAREEMEALAELREAMRWSGRKLARDFCDVIADHPCVTEVLNNCIANSCSVIIQTASKTSSIYGRAKKEMKKFFALSPLALDLCELIYIFQTNDTFESYFEDDLRIWAGAQREALACLLSTEISDLEAALSELASCSLFTDKYGRGHRLTASVLPLWEGRKVGSTDKFFCTRLEGETLPLEKFRISEEELSYVKGLLTSRSKSPVHIILYGPPGTGKTTFVRSLAKHLDLQVWGVNSREGDNDDNRRSSLIASLNIARRKSTGFVLVDEAERMLDTSWHGGGKEKDKAWLNSLLEKQGNHVIWVVNQADHIDAAVLRRFSFSVHFKSLNEQERQSMWEDILTKHEVREYFTGTQVKALAKKYPVSAAVINQAVDQAKILKCKEDKFFQAVECSIHAYSELVSHAGQKKSGNLIDTDIQDFTPDGITVEGSVADLLERCRRADAAMRDRSRILPRGCATLLFYGPPGTGKTALARYIAHELNRNCNVYRASDLLNAYVGDTEKRIAKAFKKAEDEGAVLVIDEADSFLFSRDTAQRSWEVSMVNEFLTNLEECRSFCICTTNRLDDMDSASLRRFAHKVSFNYAGQEQIMTLYNSLLAPLCGEVLSPRQEKELLSLKYLTPGDFHTVQSQHGSFFSDDPNVQHDTLIAALRREESLKSKFLGRRAGF